MDIIRIDFNDLDETEKLLAEDNLEAFKQLEAKSAEAGDTIYKNSYMTEICAFFGSNKCLKYLVDEGVEPSDLINLYAVIQDNKLCVDVPHEDELLLAVRYGRAHLIKSIRRPSVQVGIKALLLSLENNVLGTDSLLETNYEGHSGNKSFSYSDYIFGLYSQDEWKEVFVGEELRKLVKYGKHAIAYLRGIKLSEEDLLMLLEEDMDIEIDGSLLPSELTIKEGQLPTWRIEELKQCGVQVIVIELEEVSDTDDIDFSLSDSD